MLRNPWLEALLGVSHLDQVTYTDVQALVGNMSAAETAVLDYKQQVHAKDPAGKAEFGKDLAAMANYQGGVLFLGVEEDPGSATPKSVPGVSVTDAEMLRLRQTATHQVDPHLEFEIRPLRDAPGSQQGVLMVIVPRSARAPHAVADSRNPGMLGYPVRDGARTRWMTEPEIATRYRQRHQAVADLAARAEDVETDAVTAFYHADVQRTGKWASNRPLVALSLVPDQPGQLRINAASLAEANTSLTRTKGVRLGEVGVASGRFIAADNLIVREPRSLMNNYVELHSDGAGCLVSALDVTADNEATIDLEELTVEVVHVLSLLARHAHDRTAAAGVANIRLQVLATPDRLSTSRPLLLNPTGSELQDHQLMIVNPMTYTRISVHSPKAALGRASGLVEEIANGGASLAAAALLAVEEALQAFGMVELPLITPQGEVAVTQWRGHPSGAVTEFAKDYDIPMISSP